MGFFQNLFHTNKPPQSVVLIDITANSVAGAYVEHSEGEKSVVHYTRRLPIEARMNETSERSVARALLALGNTLIQEGASTLSPRIAEGEKDILVSIDSPWQHIQMHAKHINPKDSFLFTPELVATALEDTRDTTPDTLCVDQSIVGTVLNGYETRNPYGKSAQRARVVTLTSHIDRPVAESVSEALRGLFHTERVKLIAGNSLRYQALRRAFTHERNAYILDATGSIWFLALIQRDILVSITEVADATAVADEIKKLKERFGPPRALFLLMPELENSSLRQALGGTNIPAIVSVLPHHLIGLVTHAASTPPDLSLLLMALHSQQADLTIKKVGIY